MTQKNDPEYGEEHARTLSIPHILTTKLYIPQVRSDAVTRPDLVEKIEGAIAHPDTFIVISGPAGFGKTSLLSEFVSNYQRPVAWISLDDSDNDPVQFWRYFFASCQTVIGDLDKSILDALDTSQKLPDETIPTLLINELTTCEQSIILILDDYHKIQNASIHAGMRFLLEHQPTNLHVIISTRTDPPFSLIRFRARNQLTEIRAIDLRFSTDEAMEFLNRTMGLALPDEHIKALEKRTEGWIAGLQLAGLSLQGRNDISAFIRDFTGSNVYIAEYLIEEILRKQSASTQRFLLQTSILERMNAPLCEALTDCQDCQQILLGLHKSNSFIVPLDSENQWFRYHHLFGDLLQVRLSQRLSKEAIASLHVRASFWYENNDSIHEAIQHALAARDFERTALLIDNVGQQMTFTDQYIVLRDWLEALPEEVFHQHPRLEIYRTLIDLNLGTLDMYEQTLLEKERLIKALPPSTENNRLRLQATVYLSMLMAHQHTARAIQMSESTLLELPEDDLKLRAFLYSTLYRAIGMDGQFEKATSAYRECLRLAQLTGQYGMISNTTMIRAFDLCQYGRLEEAEKYCQIILDIGKQEQRKVFYPAGTAYIGLAGIHLERHDLELAENYLERGLTLCHQGGTYGLYTGYLQKARLLQAKGEYNDALAVLYRLEQRLQRRDFTLTARQVSLYLALGDLPRLANLVEPLLEILNGSYYSQSLPLIAEEAFKLYLIRIYIAQRKFDHASQLLDEVHTTVERDKRYGRLLEVYLLRALIEQKHISERISSVAITHMKRALELGEPSGFILLFLEEGTDLIPLLNGVISDRKASIHIKKYAQKIINAFATTTDDVEISHLSGEAIGLIEALTPREMEVLQRVATGASNQDIADELVITIRTVKKHLSNILGKLNANNRTQAVAYARELGLLTSD